MPLLADVAAIRGQTTSTSLQPALENDLRRIESCNPYNYMAPAAEPLRRGPSLSEPNPYKYMTTPVVPAEPTPTRSRALARGRSALAEVQGALGPELGRATSVTAPVPAPPPFERVPSFDPYEYMHTARLARGPSLSGADPFSYMGLLPASLVALSLGLNPGVGGLLILRQKVSAQKSQHQKMV